MRCTKLEIYEVKIPFRFRFKHALAERSQAHSLILVLHTDMGEIGLGEVLPRPYLTGETIESAWKDLEEIWWPELKQIEFGSADPMLALTPLYQRADRERKLAAYSGLDIAVYDAWSRALRMPLVRLWNGSPRSLRYTFPLGGGGPRRLKWLARLGRLSGYTEFKLKTGRPDDGKRLLQVRRAIGTKADLRIDANAAWSFERVQDLAPLLRMAQVSSLEQPVPAPGLESMRKIHEDLHFPVMADESLCSQADARAILAKRAASIWNLRLAKNGGFTGFRSLLELAERERIEIHHGVLVGESPILTAAARLASTLGAFRHSEYGFPALLLKQKIAQGAPRGAFGRGAPARDDVLGLGVHLHADAMAKVTVAQKVLR